MCLAIVLALCLTSFLCHLNPYYFYFDILKFIGDCIVLIKKLNVFIFSMFDPVILGTVNCFS